MKSKHWVSEYEGASTPAAAAAAAPPPPTTTRGHQTCGSAWAAG